MKILFTLLISLFSETKEISTPTATFSIVGRDPDTGEIGVAVQSKIVAVGAVVPWAKAGVGAVATQSYANVTYGLEGLRLLEQGNNPEQTIDLLIKNDPNRDLRQVGILSANGESFNFTGKKCFSWAGGKKGKNYTVQGNILASSKVVDAMAKEFESSYGKAPLAERLIAALKAAQKEGGDKRGKQSAALLVVKKDWGYGGNNDKFRDIRVDEHDKPIEELHRVYLKHCELFPRPTKYEIKK